MHRSPWSFASLALLMAFALPALGQVVTDPNLEHAVVIGGLAQPSAMAFYAPGAFLVTEKDTGRVVNVVNGVRQAGLALDLAVFGGGERGLLGIAVHPGFPQQPYVYLFYTPSATGGDTQSGTPLQNRVERFTFANGTLSSPVRILTVALPVDVGYHIGGSLAFGPDEKLYLVVGDRAQQGGLQNHPPLSSADDSSVIFRINDDGSAPGNNPLSAPGFDLSKYYAYGIRNSFGIAFDPQTGALWQSENGPDGYDEVNRVAPGFNSGWDVLMGPDSRDPDDATQLVALSGSAYSDPEFSWRTTVAPTGLAFLRGSALGASYDDSLLIGTYGGRIYRLRLNAAGTAIVPPNAGLADLVLDSGDDVSAIEFASALGGVTDLKVGPDGNLYGVAILFNLVFVIRPIAGAPDADGDGAPDASDNCRTVGNANQADGDADAVGDLCDNCSSVANARVDSSYLAANPWATLTGGQRDDDHDGYGNVCDAKFPDVTGTVVGSADLAQFRTANAQSRTADACGTLHTRPCAIFDLDENGSLIGSADLSRFRLLNGKAPGPKCALCPLVCSAGPSGSCVP